PVAEAVAVAKRDLKPGEKLGMIGESEYRGMAVNWQEGRDAGCIPIGLAEKAIINEPVKEGEMLTYKNCTTDESLIITKLRRQLDQLDGQLTGSNVA
ncbi:MAG: homoserine dehydrogenase, partial [Pseudomonadota bacterium]